MSECIRIMLVDDHAATLAGLKAVLMREPGIEIVGEASDGQTAVNLADELLPDIVIMDVFLRKPDLSDSCLPFQRTKLDLCADYRVCRQAPMSHV